MALRVGVLIEIGLFIVVPSVLAPGKSRGSRALPAVLFDGYAELANFASRPLEPESPGEDRPTHVDVEPNASDLGRVVEVEPARRLIQELSA